MAAVESIPYRSWLFAGALLVLAAKAGAQAHTCPAATPHDPTLAEKTYSHGNYDSAENLYVQALLQKPDDVTIASALIHTLLHEDKIADAARRANALADENPRSAAALTSLAEVELRQGQPWLAMQTLDNAAALDLCYARVHLIRSRIFRIDSLYASERKELQSAYQIDATDPDIVHAWRQVVAPANDIEGTEKALATMKNVDAELREKAQASVDSMLPLLSENSQTCRSSAIATPVTIPLTPVLQDVKHISGYRLDVQFSQGKASLQVDTAASGLYISRALADANRFQHQSGMPENTVHVDSLRIGPLEFRNCMVGVSDQPFPDKGDGFIGTDIFASYWITLNYPAAKLELAPLPILPKDETSLPGDRYVAADMRDYSPVYHRLQYLMLPVVLNKQDRRLFVLDTGMRVTTMTADVAHAISKTKINFTNNVQTVSGGTLHMYRDSFDFQFANLVFANQGQVLEFDPSTISQNAKIEVAGLLGFDMLHTLVIHLDYRDGLVKFDASGANQPGASRTLIASITTSPADAACGQYANQNTDLPIQSTIEASVPSWLDSGHLKPGETIFVRTVHGWQGDVCNFAAGAAIYGHVVLATTTKDAAGPQLAIVFDHGDCVGQAKKSIPFRVIALVGPAGEHKAYHDAMPTQVRGGSRDISQTVATMDIKEDENLNPGGPPNTVHPGIVADLPELKLVPEGGPQCSALLTSTKSHSVRLGAGTEFILTMQMTRNR
jgi:tetratricopeptide (TPR) repeat protein